MKLIPLAFCILFSSAIFGQNIKINGNIRGIGNDTLFVQYMSFSQRMANTGGVRQDRVPAVNGRFSITITANDPVLLKIESKRLLEKNKGLSAQSKMLFLMPSPGESLLINGELDEENFLAYTLSGSDLNRGLAAFRLKTRSFITELDRLQLQIKALNTTSKEKNESARQKLRSNIAAVSSRLAEFRLDYVKRHPDKELSVFLLCQQPLDTLGVYAKLLGTDAKEGRFKELLNQQMKLYKKRSEALNKSGIVIGRLAPNFTLKSPDGKEVALYSIENEFVLLDFWGSWCVWCVGDFPKMKEFYRKNKNKLEILGVACKDKEQAWLKAIKKYDLEWINVIDNAQTNISEQYVLDAYPTKILLDKQKKIIGIFKGEIADIYDKIQALMD